MNASQFFVKQRLDESAKFSAIDLKIFAEKYLEQHLRNNLIELYRKTLDFSKISNIEMADIDTKDYPDFADAYIQSCDYDGEPATDEMLEVINEDGDFVYEQVMKRLH